MWLQVVLLTMFTACCWISHGSRGQRLAQENYMCPTSVDDVNKAARGRENKWSTWIAFIKSEPQLKEHRRRFATMLDSQQKKKKRGPKDEDMRGKKGGSWKVNYSYACLATHNSHCIQHCVGCLFLLHPYKIKLVYWHWRFHKKPLTYGNFAFYKKSSLCGEMKVHFIYMHVSLWTKKTFKRNRLGRSCLASTVKSQGK